MSSLNPPAAMPAGVWGLRPSAMGLLFPGLGGDVRRLRPFFGPAPPRLGSPSLSRRHRVMAVCRPPRCLAAPALGGVARGPHLRGGCPARTARRGALPPAITGACALLVPPPAAHLAAGVACGDGCVERMRHIGVRVSVSPAVSGRVWLRLLRAGVALSLGRVGGYLCVCETCVDSRLPCPETLRHLSPQSVFAIPYRLSHWRDAHNADTDMPIYVA